MSKIKSLTLFLSFPTSLFVGSIIRPYIHLQLEWYLFFYYTLESIFLKITQLINALNNENDAFFVVFNKNQSLCSSSKHHVRIFWNYNPSQWSQVLTLKQRDHLPTSFTIILSIVKYTKKCLVICLNCNNWKNLVVPSQGFN